MKEVNDVNRCSRQLGPGCGSHGGAYDGNNRWAALPGVATLRLTRLEVATVMLMIEAREWLHDVNKKTHTLLTEHVYSVSDEQPNERVANQGQTPDDEPWQQFRNANWKRRCQRRQ